MKRRFAQLVIALWLAGMLAATAEETNAPVALPLPVAPPPPDVHPETNVLAATNSPVATNSLAASNIVETVGLTNAPATNDLSATNTPVPAPNGEPGREELTTANSDKPAVPATGNDLRAFRIISERNIFNPNRTSRGSYTRPVVTRREPERRPAPARSESFALVGTMSYEKGSYAFFEGSVSDYRKVLQPDGVIAGFKVTSVTPKCVTLEHDGKSIELCVGMQMRKSDDEQDWKMQERTETSESSSSSRYASSSGRASASVPALGSAAEEEILRRLMQKREQEGGPVETPNPQPTIEIPPPPPAPVEVAEPPLSPEEAEILRRLQQRREQENQR